MSLTEQKTKEELEALVRALSWNDAFGCYTRNGFEKVVWPEIADQARWIIYFDIDNMHDLNASFGGYEAVDAMIKLGLSVLRWTDYVACQLQSGDEFLVCMIEGGPQSPIKEQRETLDPERLKERLSNSLKLAGLTATFAIVPVTSPDLLTNVKPAIDIVYQAKNNRPAGTGRRSTI